MNSGSGSAGGGGNISTTTTTTNNTTTRMLSGNSNFGAKKRPSVSKLDEISEAASTTLSQASSLVSTNLVDNHSEQSIINTASSRYENSMEERKQQQQTQQQQLQKKTNDLLKAKNYLRAHLKLQENMTSTKGDTTAGATDLSSSSNIPSSRMRSNSFLMSSGGNKNSTASAGPSSELANLMASYDGGGGGGGKNSTNEATVNLHGQSPTPTTSTHVAPVVSRIHSQLSQHLQQQAALKSSLVANTQTSLARHYFTNNGMNNKKTSNENLKTTISRIARQKSGEQLKTMSMNEKQLTRETSSNAGVSKKEEPPAFSSSSSSSSASASATAAATSVYTNAGTNTSPMAPKSLPSPLVITASTNGGAVASVQQQQQQQQQLESSNGANRKELLLIPSDKLADYIHRSIGRLKAEENANVVDQMASFIDELKDFIDDRLIDTTSQLEMSNRHIYHLYKSVNYLIKEVSSLKIQNEELKQELFILNSRLTKTKSNTQQQSQQLLQQQPNPATTVPICCGYVFNNSNNNGSTSNTKKGGVAAKPSDYLLVESPSHSDERDLSRLSELSTGEANNEISSGGRASQFYNGMYNNNDDDEQQQQPRNLNYLNWQRRKPSLNGGLTASATTSTTTVTTGVNTSSNNANNAATTLNSNYAVDIDEPNGHTISNSAAPNGGATSIIIMATGDRFVSSGGGGGGGASTSTSSSTDEDTNIDQVKLNKLLNCEVDYFKGTGAPVATVRSAHVSPKKASSSSAGDGLKLIDQLLQSSKAIDAHNKRLSVVTTTTNSERAVPPSPPQSVDAANSSKQRAREVLSKSSIVHHLHTSLAPFTSLINDFDAQYSWDYTDNNNI